ncbi:polysaccharide ABC transporter ATP-binding protein [Bordetella bronchiseptica]|uniref:ABC transporter ATP-binding protein n=1 Tax=Bordetella bronchiseptica TaxID=518 RepID=UPI00045AEEB1|nr:ABC transporter ATP-binding protein [Bordetella bronchiseptica]KAK51529.1 ABC transporter, ATP-binding protein [Bordetella bronchiseptica OSU054]
MSSSTTPESLAISLKDVSKIYRLHGSQGDQLIDVLGLQRFGFRTRTPAKEFAALSDVSLEVPRGHRIGIVGRNGAGKTTLLKLICGNFAPTSGAIEVHGNVQALMNVGLGFHPEYTGRENVEASLQYNGLAKREYDEAIQGIVEFCELGDFLDQPFKTYSLGMQARLMFATATAIRPDILIVDEVLGAGDAYFVAKSKVRVERLVSSGCTMLLVSHSMQQILELCDEAIWMDQGRIRMRGEAFLVVKAYEEYLHGPIAQLAPPSPAPADGGETGSVATTEASMPEGDDAPCDVRSRQVALPDHVLLQEPRFLPHGQAITLAQAPAAKIHFEAPGGISRWESDPGVKVVGFAVMTERGLCDTLVSMRPAEFVVDVIAEHTGTFHCRYGIALHDHLGACVARIFSPADEFDIQQGQIRRIRIALNPCQLGPGDYTVGISILPYAPLEQLNNSSRYDLLSRSFAIRVELPESLGSLAANFFHTAEWNFGS